MSITLSFVRMFSCLISLLFSLSFATQYFEGGWNGINVSIGLLGGALLSSLLIGFDFLFRRFNFRSFNIAIFGLFAGYLMAQALLFMIEGISGWELTSQAFLPLRFIVYLVCAYVGMILILQATEELHISLPFVEFKQISQKKKDILVDLSILTDARIIDLASTGLLDYHLIIPRFAMKELYIQAETGDEGTKAKARRSLEIVKKLDSLPSLNLRYVETDFPEIKDPMIKLIRLARFLDTHIITSDINRIQQSSIEGVRIINIHMLSNALKPITLAGESIKIRIQRYGKEARQGVGYLEDGTMVVVNGGAEFIGETIKAYVLSFKHTPSGRMIFCNAAEEMANSLLHDSHDAGDFHSSTEDSENNKSILTL